MRFVIDLQGAQTESRFRGIGRYSLALALAMARNAGEHEIWLLLNAGLAASIAPIRRAFAGLVPRQRIRVFDIPGPVAQIDPANAWRARTAEQLREHCIAQLRPDMVLVTSLFEGYIDDGVTSIGAFCGGERTAVVHYDLIPLLDPDVYLSAPTKNSYYRRKLRSLGEAGLLLAISDYSRREATQTLQLDPSKVVNISSAVDPSFQPVAVSPEREAELRRRFGFSRQLVMCAPGGFDTRKNIDGLIAAYGLLPAALRAGHQLLLASRVDDLERQRLEGAARKAGLAVGEMVLTGYLGNDELLALYSLATLFVYPSKHEGFGLPALEAMACGAAVIGADATSVPEVIGCDEALFDPASPQAIADKIAEVLRSGELQARLRQHGLNQARKFCWEQTAIDALRALEARAAVAAAAPRAAPAAGKRRLAFVSPLPPERTGIANYSVELLPALAALFDIELVTDQATITLPPSLSSLVRRSSDWFAANGGAYERIVYQFGNSPFHSHMLRLLRLHPGVVVLHDFFLSGMLAHEELSGRAPGAWSRALFHSHGYLALRDRTLAASVDETKNRYPCNLEVLQDARGVIVHSAYSRTLAQAWYGASAADDWTLIPHLRTAATSVDRRGARAALGLAEDAFVVCSFGFVAPTKLTERLLEAWLASRLAAATNCLLLLVGENDGGEYGKRIVARIGASACRERIRITGWADDAVYGQYLQAADLAVQLRTLSRGETSGALLHCLNHGTATIINAHGSMADVPSAVTWKLPDAFADAELVGALESLWSDGERRRALGSAAAAYVKAEHSPESCANQYAAAIEGYHAAAQTDRHALLRSLAAIDDLPATEAALQGLAQAVALSTRETIQPRQLLVDVSAIARHDLQTGIERVVRAQLNALLAAPPPGCRVEPVYLSQEAGAWHYRYAREYTQRLLGISATNLVDEAVDVEADDIFYSPDFYPDGVIAAAASGLYARWRALGVELSFLVHDLLPILRPEFFPEQADQLHGRWLACVAANADRLVCISGAVADEVRQQLAGGGNDALPPPEIAVVHHGADIEASVPSSGLPDGALDCLQRLAATPAFLMLGTIEPRKGHLQTLAAFERLWRDGSPVKLVIVGREGWTALAPAQRRTIPAIVARLRHHPELGRRLFWLEGISDEYLAKVFAACACLIIASEGEGFGLPLIEAARRGLPIIARDLPVFREVAQDHAYYFKGHSGEELATAIGDWLALDARGAAPSSTAIRWRTWAQNAAELVALLTRHDDNQAGQANHIEDSE